MSDHSKIEWTDATWNPVRGCTKISPGCAHCYAESFAERFRGVPGHPYEQGFDLRLVPEKLTEPLRWTKPKTVFVNSMSDLFHKDVSDRYIRMVGEVMRVANWHTYQVLTKRPERMAELLRTILRPLADLPHIWWGVSVENRRHGLPRVEHLRAAPAAVRFLSVEPLLEDLGAIDLTGISWVIAGGESGYGARPMRGEWVRSLRGQCQDAGVPFFFKQWGGVRKSEAGRELDGQTYDEIPTRCQNAPPPVRIRSKLILAIESQLVEALSDSEGQSVIPSLQKFGDRSWTQDKLERVRKYLVAYSTIMRKRDLKYAYIDAFAGTGYHELRQEEDEGKSLFPEASEPEVERFLDGSARIALQVEPQFDKYIFIEKSKKKTAELEKLRVEFSGRRDIEIVKADANAYLQDMCLNKLWRKHRAVLFLDPFGMQVSWETMKAVAKTKAIDTWILFPVAAVNRLLKGTGEIPETWRRRLDTLFGEPDWYDAFFPEEPSPGLFGEEVARRRKAKMMSTIGKYFNDRLASVFAAVAPNPFTLRNSRAAPLYLLCFAASNPNASAIAIKIAQDILKRDSAEVPLRQ